MKYFIIHILSIYILYSCKINNNEWKEYSINGVNFVGKFENGKKVGRHFKWYNDENQYVGMESYDDEGNLDGVTIEFSGKRNMVNYVYWNLEEGSGSDLIYFEKCDTLFKSNKNKVIGYSLVNDKEKVLEVIGKPNHCLFFDNSKSLLKIVGNPTKHLTSKDSSILDQYIPNWKVQVSNFQNKKVNGGN